MAQFQFKATHMDGSVYEGTREATDKYALYHDLKKEGDTVINAREIGAKKGFFLSALAAKMTKMKTMGISGGGNIKIADKIIFARNTGAMLDAGLPLSRILAVMEKQSKNQGLKTLFHNLNEKVKSGTSFNEALKQYPKTFPPLFFSMVKAGEESGSLANSLKILADQMEKTYLLQKRIRGAFIYPCIILSLMIVIAILMMVFVVPTLSATFSQLGETLPLSTQFIIDSSNLFRDHLVIVLGGIFLVILALVKAFRTKKGKRLYDYTILRIPIIGQLVKESNSARTTRTLSSLLSSGVEFVVAVDITMDVLQNSFYKKIMQDAKEVIQKGDPISGVFVRNEYYYPAFVAEMASVGEETGKLADMLLGVAAYYEEEVDQRTKDMSTIIEPFLMILIGVAVGFFAVAMIEPLYSVMNNL